VNAVGIWCCWADRGIAWALSPKCLGRGKAGLIFVGNILVSASNLVEAGTIAIVLDDETIHDVPAAELRRPSDEFGHDRIKAFMMAPVEFEKFRAVMKRREEQAVAAAA
jgi:hypothetical protein